MKKKNKLRLPLKIEVGKTYEDGTGEVVSIISLEGDSTHPFLSACGFYYNSLGLFGEKGMVGGDDLTSKYNLVRLDKRSNKGE